MEQNVFINRIKSSLGHLDDAQGREQALFNNLDPLRFDGLFKTVRDRSNEDLGILYKRLVAAAEPLNLKVIKQPNVKSASESIVDLVRDSLPEWGDAKSLVTWDHPLINAMELERLLADQNVPVFSPQTNRFNEQGRKSFREKVKDAYVGVTSADYCMADTATLVMKTRAGQARSISLVPSIHITVINKSQIIKDMQELFALLHDDPAQKAEGLTNCMTFISGPSKTADIEATLVHGAHGPREMYLYVVDE